MRHDANGTTAATAAGDESGSAMMAPEAWGGADAAHAKPARGFGRALVDWLLVRSELAQARVAAAQLSSERREFVRRAKLALEFGELAFAPGSAVRSGSTAPLASNFFRQAVYWALLAQRVKLGPVSPEQLWSETERSLLPVDENEYTYLEGAMRYSFIELAEGSEEAQRAQTVRLHRAAKSVVTAVQRIIWRVQWAKLKRVMRVALVMSILVAAGIGLWPAKVDMAKGKPWRVSSIGSECHPEKSECAGGKTDILFHTLQEQNPWFEYDFGAPIAFSSLTIRNRTDYGEERALPLVVEVSNDGQSFTQVTRREATFSTWKPSFTTQHARYLRLRVARESILHLEAIKVHP